MTSTQSTAPRPSKTTHKKPYDEFPLFPHQNGSWCKKVRKKLRYFGRIVDDPKGEAALKLWDAQKEALLAGREPTQVSDAFTVKDLCNRFRTAKLQQLETGDINARTYADYVRVCDYLVRELGGRRVDDLRSADFETLRTSIKSRGMSLLDDSPRKPCNQVTLSNAVTRIRVVFNYAFQADLIDRPVKYGPTFRRAKKKDIRKENRKKGVRLFTSREVRALIDSASPQMRAMILLGINLGFGNNDCGMLPLSAVDFDNGWIDFPRPKTEVERRGKLWPETIDALRGVLAERQEPADAQLKPLVFVTMYGKSWAKETPDSPVSKETRKLLDSITEYKCDCGYTVLMRNAKEPKCSVCGKELAQPKKPGIHKKGVGFYSLRHTFRTVAAETKDIPAIRHIMGHTDKSIDAIYTHDVSDERLQAVTDYVHDWLFPRPTVAGPASSN